MLKILKVDLRYVDNGKKHHTDKYDLMSRDENQRLVVRRGQDFSIDIHFDRNFNEDRDGVSFVISIGGEF